MRAQLMACMMFIGVSYCSDSVSQEDEAQSTQETYFPLDTRMFNEGKGHTLWIDPPKTQELTWAKYGDLSHKTRALVEIPSEFEITTADRTSYQDARALHHMMEAHNASFVRIESMNYWMVVDLLGKEVFAQNDNTIVVKFDNLVNLYAVNRESDIQYHAALRYVMDCGRYLKAQKIFVETMNFSDATLNSLCVALGVGLRELNFSAKAQPKPKNAPARFIVHQRSLNDNLPDKDLPKIWYPLTPKMTNNKLADTRDSAINDFTQTRNLVLRNTVGNCLGGICCVLSERDASKLLELNIHVIAESIRGQGYGRKMMESLIKLNEKIGADIWIHPTSFHNTRFLERLGFVKAVTYPQFLTDKNSQRYYDQYKYFYNISLENNQKPVVDDAGKT